AMRTRQSDSSSRPGIYNRTSDMSVSALFRSGKARLLTALRGVDSPALRFERIDTQHREILQELRKINDALSTAARNESQLRAVLERGAELDPHLSRLDETLHDPATAGHIGE